MNAFFFVTILDLFLFYFVSLKVSTGIAMIIFFIAIITLIGAAFWDLNKSSNKKRATHLRLVK
ncbi:hypothetical protein [Bacillus dakarensis]|uniref:hypothetical protein n=1 Tax=Robertmurraya dakarensis TaxID=1926278 RepID=UPI0009823E7D|nr:hypothetical protein [Bacillus dakarensis]